MPPSFQPRAPMLTGPHPSDTSHWAGEGLSPRAVPPIPQAPGPRTLFPLQLRHPQVQMEFREWATPALWDLSGGHHTGHTSPTLQTHSETSWDGTGSAHLLSTTGRWWHSGRGTWGVPNVLIHPSSCKGIGASQILLWPKARPRVHRQEVVLGPADAPHTAGGSLSTGAASPGQYHVLPDTSRRCSAHCHGRAVLEEGVVVHS